MEPSRTHKILSVTIVAIAGVLLAGIFVAGYLVLLQYAGTANDGVMSDATATSTESQSEITGLSEEELYSALTAPLDPEVDAAAIGVGDGLDFNQKLELLEAEVTEEAEAGEMLSEEDLLQLLNAPLTDEVIESSESL